MLSLCPVALSDDSIGCKSAVLRREDGEEEEGQIILLESVFVS